jgi:hypothetical protein
MRPSEQLSVCGDYSLQSQSGWTIKPTIGKPSATKLKIYAKKRRTVRCFLVRSGRQEAYPDESNARNG